ncbi:MAG: pilus assembly protein, partial [Mesorhizobium sp.]
VGWTTDTQQKLGFIETLAKGMTMSETYYLRPRRSVTIPCSDC